jgi:cold shock CspA family protein
MAVQEVSMQVPIQIVLKKVPHPAVVREEVLRVAGAMDHFHDRITSCRVAVMNSDARHRKGALYDVHISMRVPGRKDIEVSRRAEDQPEREHLKVALRKAFAQARRQLQDVVRELRGDVKARAEQELGRVAKLFASNGYGIIEKPDGREIYFHRNSVTDKKFRTLKLGSQVRFVEVEGEKGAQASTVVPIAGSRVPKPSTTLTREVKRGPRLV